MESTSDNYLTSTKKLFRYYKTLGDAAIERVDEAQIHWQFNEGSNSMVTIVKHISGNSLSRWTDFLTTDGEKEWRDRDNEFEESAMTKSELTALWEKGWACLLNAIDPLVGSDLARVVYIRNEGHTVLEAMNRQLAHLPYHIGQMVFLAKMMNGSEWQSLSIPKGKSLAYNKDKFTSDQKTQFFTDGMDKK